MLFLLPNLSFASIDLTATSNQKIVLTPSTGTDKIVDYIVMEKNEDEVVIAFENGLKNIGYFQEMEIEVDVNKNSYNIMNYQEKSQTLPRSTTRSAYVAIITLDPINLELNRTTQSLNWNTSGLVSRNKAAVPKNPSAVGTHWYTMWDRWTELRTIDGGRTLVSTNNTKYYNADFLSNNKFTYAEHTISIHATKASAGYVAILTGERSGLL